MTGNCKLCKIEKELQDSHVIPKFLYRYMRKHQDKTKSLNGLLVLDGKNNKVDVTQRQWKKKLFCKECESLLSKNETKFSRIFHDINSMKKEEIKKIAFSTDYEQLWDDIKNEIHPSPTFDEYKNVVEQGYFDDVKAETLKYFSASYVLRQLYLLENTLGQKEVDMLESYLLGNGDGDFNLLVSVNSGEPFKAVCSSLVLDSLDNFKHYNFIVPEIWFHLIFDINNELGVKKVTIVPDDFLNNKVIIDLLSRQYKDTSITEKARQAIEK